MISIIIPTLNEEKIIGKTLAYLKDNLKETEYEVIISDGKSSDKTAVIARKCADRVVVYGGRDRQTIAHSRNLGAAQARGRYLVFIDADVVVPNPNKFFKKALEIFKESPKLVGLGVFIRVSPEVETWGDKFFSGLVNYIYLVSNNLFGIGKAPGEFQMVKLGAFRKTGGFNEQLVAAEDNEFFYRLSRIGQTRIASNLTVFHGGRRAHAIGWPRLIWTWFLNAMSVTFFKRAVSKEWEEVR